MNNYEYLKEWRLKNKDKVKQYHKNYYEKYKEREQERSRKYREEHIEERKEYNRKYKERKKQELNKYKEVIDKALYWLSENTHYTDFNVDKLVLDENVNLKELLELLEEIE